MTKIFTGVYSFLMAAFLMVYSTPLTAQTGVLNPADTVAIYNPASPPVTPVSGTLVKWVKSNRLSWNTSSFKAYFYRNVAFRLKFPKTYQHNVQDGKKYPLYIFFHGIGEKGVNIYDNEYQLYQGGSEHRDAVDNGKFDGFLLYIQSTTSSGFFGDSYYNVVQELIEKYFVPEIKVDINRICVDGLSGGGNASWEFVTKYPKLVAGVLPISSNSVDNADVITSLKYTPIWNFQGALDNNPSPGTSKYVRDSYLNAGANYKYTEFPDIGHGCWFKAWADADYYPFMLRANKANPWPVSGRTGFCNGDPVNLTLGVTAGFDGYEWRKNGVTIAGASANTLVINSLGTYDCRVKRGTQWSPYSPQPLVIKIKDATVPPPIQVKGLASKVVPSPDGKTGVNLLVPEGYATYDWQRTSNTTTLSTQNILNNATAGSYKVKVTEQYGCSTSFSNPFTVINANGANGPDAPTNLKATATSKTDIKLTWSVNANPAYSATNYEIYQATSSGGAYTLINIAASNAVTYTASDLNPKTTYYYKVRAINNNAASAVAGPAIITTLSDTLAPSAPANLKTGVTTQNSVELIWNPSTDDVAVTNYDIYINSVKSYVLDGGQTRFIAYNLTRDQSYTFAVKARDFSGNASAFSNQVLGVATPGSGGPEPVNMVYVNFNETSPEPLPWNSFNSKPLAGASIKNLKDYTSAATGINITLLDTWTAANEVGKITGNNSGVYPDNVIKTAYVEQTTNPRRIKLSGLSTSKKYNLVFFGSRVATDVRITKYGAGGQTVALNASNNNLNTVQINGLSPNTSGEIDMTVTKDSAAVYGYINAMVIQSYTTTGIPLAPASLVATPASKTGINLKWADRSANETGFEIWRASSYNGAYTLLTSVAANIKTYTNSGLSTGSNFYYKVRAKSGEGNSEYSNPAAATTFSNVVYINFNETSPEPLPWNSLNSKPNTGAGLTNLKNDVSSSTGINLTLLDTWTAANEVGKVTGNNSGVYPDNVIKTAYVEESTNDKHIRLSGLSSANKYNLVFFGSRVATDIRLTKYIAGGQTVILNASNNTSNTVQINGLSPNTAGVIDITVSKDDAAIYAYINAMAIQSYTVTGIPLTPVNLLAGTSKNTINLSWADQSDNETGFEIWRSASYNGTYTLLATVAANATTYANTGLPAGSRFYYKIRAKGIAGNSDYTGAAEGSTFSSLLYVNFNQTLPNALPWNNFNSAPNAGVALTNIKDDSNAASGINVTLLDKWTGANESGKITGNNSGAYPDNVIKTAYIEQTTSVKRIKLNGLSTSKKYNLVFFGSTIASDARITKYTALGKTVSLNASNNSSNTVRLSALSPNANGEIEITVAKDATSAYGYINAMSIQSYAPSGLPTAPGNLAAIGTSRTSINLTWADRSDNETGFEIWRSDSYYGTYILLSSVGANITNYSNSGLAEGSKYYYKVRAKAALGNSDYSNTAAGSAFSYMVYVNFNRDMPAGTPWNNTNNVPSPGYTYNNFTTDKSTASGINLTVIDNFTGDNVLGMNTGNNSGVYPDNVIRSAWFTDAGITAKIKISGLNSAFGYSFIFFGSRTGNGDTVNRTTVYSIGSKSVSLNATNNISQTVRLTNVAPDANGEVFITVSKGGSSPFGYLNALVIQAYSSSDSTVSQPTYQRIVGTNADTLNGNLALLYQNLRNINSTVQQEVEAFPNPFVEDITVKLSLKKAIDKLQILVRDAKGNILYSKDLRNVPQGVSQHKLGITNKIVVSGVYFVQVIGLPAETKNRVIKLVK